jgi:hypothetical protein
VKIPVTLVVPSDVKASPFPLVILLHGHGGTRHEAGGYSRVAQGIAKHGIASIRMDFPGCGDSLEGFENNNLTNMIADIQSSKAHALKTLNIDQSRLGLLGFSMGGRLALTLGTTDPDYRAIGLWAPDAETGEANIREFLGGSDRYEQMRTIAMTQGFAPFTTGSRIWKRLNRPAQSIIIRVRFLFFTATRTRLSGQKYPEASYIKQLMQSLLSSTR